MSSEPARGFSCFCLSPHLRVKHHEDRGFCLLCSLLYTKHLEQNLEYKGNRCSINEHFQWRMYFRRCVWILGRKRKNGCSGKAKTFPETPSWLPFTSPWPKPCPMGVIAAQSLGIWVFSVRCTALLEQNYCISKEEGKNEYWKGKLQCPPHRSILDIIRQNLWGW